MQVRSYDFALITFAKWFAHFEFKSRLSRHNNQSVEKQFRIFSVALVAVFVSGCGGSGKSSGVVSPLIPNAKTKSDVASILAGYGQTVALNSFTGVGSRLIGHRTPTYDSTLGLWYTALIAPDFVSESLFVDQAGTIPAGSLHYTLSDETFALSGNFSVTAGPYAGATGSYLQNLISNSFNGSITMTIPNVATADSQYEFQQNSSGGIYGTSTNGVSLASGYGQTELVNLQATGAFSATTTDSNACASSFNFTATYSGTGVVTGKDSGLPAKVSWAAGGSGTVTYADGSQTAFTNWQVPSPTGSVGRKSE